MLVNMDKGVLRSEKCRILSSQIHTGKGHSEILCSSDVHIVI